MEVHHKPQPWRGWGEFLKEYGIIVLGVLTALASEQIVEAAHHHYQVRDLRRALDQELAWDLARMKDYADVSGCVTQRLDELDRWSRSFHPGGPLKLHGRIEAWPGLIFRTSIWRSAAGATIDQMPLGTRVAYAQFYDGVQNNDLSRSRVRDLWDDLAEFEDAATLAPEQLRRVSHDIKRIRDFNRVAIQNYDIWRTIYAPPLGVRVEDAPERAMSQPMVARARAEICRPLLAM